MSEKSEDYKSKSSNEILKETQTGTLVWLSGKSNENK